METQETVRERRQVWLRDCVPGDNPRPESEFDPAYLKWLAGTIDAHDFIHLPIVRERADGKYPISVGERRIRAARLSERYGEDGQIWVEIERELDDAKVQAKSLIENVVRQPTSALAEAEYSSKLLASCENDRRKLAKLLGWDVEQVDKRLALMNAAEDVRNALREKKIELGHAELLAAMRKEAQLATLESMLKAPKLVSVAGLKAMLEVAALVLDTAIFDKKDCAGCPHNSSVQGAMFAEAITGSKCTNKPCFEAKTEEELQRRAKALEEDFQQVRIARPGENFTIIPLKAEGPKGVGAEQAQACRSCAKFGAVVSAVPDKLGQVFKEMCFDPVCNVRMVAAHNKLQPAVAPDSNGRSPESQAAGAKPAKPPAAGKSSVARPAEIAPRVKEYREKLWRLIFKAAIAKLDLVQNRAVLVALCMTKPGVLDEHALREAFAKTLKVDGMVGPGKVIKLVLELDQKDLAAIVNAIASNVRDGPVGGLAIEDVTGILKAFGVQVSDHWKITKPFFELLTKNEIDAVCDEIGLKEALGADYNKAAKGSKPEFIDALLGAKFDFTGKVPRVMTW